MAGDRRRRALASDTFACQQAPITHAHPLFLVSCNLETPNTGRSFPGWYIENLISQPCARLRRLARRGSAQQEAFKWQFPGNLPLHSHSSAWSSAAHSPICEQQTAGEPLVPAAVLVLEAIMGPVWAVSCICLLMHRPRAAQVDAQGSRTQSASSSAPHCRPSLPG